MPAVSSPETAATQVGDTFFRAYDQAVMNKLLAFESDGRFWLKLNGVPAPSYPDDWEQEELRRQTMPGIPVIFALPHETIAHYVNPSIVCRRQDPVLAMERWNGQRLKYVRPADGATPVTVNYSSGLGPNGQVVQQVLTGYDKYEQKRAPWPFDMNYTLLARAEGEKAETYGQLLYRHLLRNFPPRDNVDVTDSLGDTYGETMFAEAPVSLKEVMDIAHRVCGWSVSLRILGYFDVEDPSEVLVVTKPPVLTLHQK